MTKPILIDTDPGVDDVLAILLAFRSPELSIKAITTVAGNVAVKKCTKNVLRLLEFIKPIAMPIVAEGAKKPLRAKQLFAPEVHGSDGLGNSRFRLPKPTLAISEKTAADVILEHCQEFPHELEIIALGPLTNLANAFLKNAKTFRLVKKIISMGGVFRIAGNTGITSEFNYYADPEAAHLILNSDLPVTVVPLDFTQKFICYGAEFDDYPSTPHLDLIRILTRFYMQYHLETEQFFGGYLHDPIALALAIQPEWAETIKLHVDVETTGRFTRGMTVTDFRKLPSPHEPFVQVVLDGQIEKLSQLVRERLLNPLF